MAQQLKFALTAYDPNPTEVTLSMSGEQCTVESCERGNITVEDYKSVDGNPYEIYLKVTPEPIAFIMRFVDGQMTIEFKGNWTAFKTEMDNRPKEVASSIISFKTHLKPSDVDAQLIQLDWKAPNISALNGDSGECKYEVVHQKDVEEGREFVLKVTHPDGTVFVLRCVIKGDRITILNTDLWYESHLEGYLSFYIKDEGRIGVIKKEIAANPDKDRIGILYKHGCYGEGVAVNSLVPYICHMDADGNQAPKTEKDDDDSVKKNRELRKKAEDAGKKGTEAPDDGKDWSCGRVKWSLPTEDRTYRDVGKLAIPDFGAAEEGPHLRDVGKLQWGGFVEEEPVVKKEPVKVGKLNAGMFGGGAPEEEKPAPAKRSWKKK